LLEDELNHSAVKGTDEGRVNVGIIGRSDIQHDEQSLLAFVLNGGKLDPIPTSRSATAAIVRLSPQVDVCTLPDATGGEIGDWGREAAGVG
jgi:hypothetical protein